MDSFVDYSGQSGFHDDIEGTAACGNQQHPRLEPPMASSFSDVHKPAFYNPNGVQHIPCDIKPRLTKEQHDVLEAHYQKVPKPTTMVKKNFAEQLGVSLDKVNVSVPLAYSPCRVASRLTQ